EFRQTPPLYTARFHWATAKGATDLRDFVQRGFDLISPEELREIDARWLGNPLELPLEARYFYYLAVLAFALVAGTVLLIVWNRMLQTRVAARTAELMGQKQVLELIAEGAPLRDTLDALARAVEAQSPGMLCSILLLDEDGRHLHHGA